jgi:uncharacterized membrane protein YphA (DoxX/SURF4 family)
MAGTQVVHRREVEVVRAPVPVEAGPPTRAGAVSAFTLLRVGYALLPIVAGADKFFNILTSWDMYLASPIAQRLPVTPERFMRISGVVEIFAGLLVAAVPRVGACIVALWLAAITGNLLLSGGNYDVALRDFGLMLGAIALWLLARRPVRQTVVVRE